MTETFSCACQGLSLDEAKACFRGAPAELGFEFADDPRLPYGGGIRRPGYQEDKKWALSIGKSPRLEKRQPWLPSEGGGW